MELELEQLSEILFQGTELAELSRKYVARLLLEVDENLVSASVTSGILLGLSFLERTNAVIKAEMNVLENTSSQ